MTKEENGEKIQNEYEKNIPYVVIIKDKYLDKLFETTIQNGFCGYLVNQNDGNFYFELIYNRMLVIIPHSYIKTMAPAMKYFKKAKERMKYK